MFRADAVKDFMFDFAARVHLVRAKYALVKNDVDCAVDAYHCILECLATIAESKQTVDEKNKDVESTPHPDVVIDVVNCVVDARISAGTIRAKLEGLQSSQSVDEIRELAEAGNHVKVVDLLLASLDRGDVRAGGEKRGGRGAADVVVERLAKERRMQMLLLINSLLLLNDYEVGHRHRFYFGCFL